MGNPERKSITEGAAEVTKKVGYLMAALGSGIIIIFKEAVGMALIVGGALVIIPPNMLENWARKRRTSQATG